MPIGPRLLASLLLAALLTATAPVRAAESYTPDPAFMSLFKIFPRGEDPKGIGVALADDMAKQSDRPDVVSPDGPLVIVSGDGIFAYDGRDRSLLMAVRTRNDPATGFFEMTAVSHIGPALAYLAALKEQGSETWKPLAQRLLADIEAARRANAKTDPNWLDRLELAAWKGREDAIRRMMDYGLWMAGDYLSRVLDGSAPTFTTESVGTDFYRAGDPRYPIPFDNVMIATFALVALTGAYDIRQAIVAAGDRVNWKNARVVVHMPIGTNYGAGLTVETNQLAAALPALTDNALPAANILIAPYALAPCPTIEQGGKTYSEVGCADMAIGAAVLDEDIYDFYSKDVWYGIYDRTQITRSAFPGVETIARADTPAIPGDYKVTKAGDIDAFIARLKLSLIDGRELLSNAVGYWVPYELAAKGWDPAKADIPGLTAGFPAGVSGYPQSNPAFVE